MGTIEFPVLGVKMIPLSKIQANDYNPNKIASPEMKLLELSIREDGYTQPIVCYYSKKYSHYIIVDGFHRFYLAKNTFHLKDIPAVVINKDIANRMASTIRHNRARGKHNVQGMVNIVENFIKSGWDEDQIARMLGMENEEIIRLRQATCLKTMFANHTFTDSWKEFENRYYKKNI